MDNNLTCPHCFKPVPEGARFCKFCGSEINTGSSEEGILICPRCKTQNRGTAHFCKKCGHKLEPIPPKNPFTGLQTEYDAFLQSEITALESCRSLSFSEFLSRANELSAHIDGRIAELINRVGTDATSPFSDVFSNHLREGRSKVQEKVWRLCEDVRARQEKEQYTHSAQDGFDSMPKDRWKGIIASKGHLSQDVYLGHSEIRCEILGKNFSFDAEQRCELLHKNNLVIRFDSNTEQGALGIVSSLAGRWLKASCGNGFNITVIDTQAFWGLGNSFNKLGERIHRLICDNHEASQELEAVLQYEQNIIRNKLSAQTPSAKEYNLTHSDIIPLRLLVVRNFPVDVLSGLDTLQRIMRNSARVGLCVVLMVNEEELRRMVLNRTSREIEVESWTGFAEEFDLTKSRYSFLPEGSTLIPEILSDVDLMWIVDEVNEALSTTPEEKAVDIADYINQIDRVGNVRLNLSLFIGTVKSTFAQQFLILDDMSMRNSLMVSGASDSLKPIYNWMESIALYALSRYSPDSLSVVFCDFSDVGAFSAFEGRMRNVVVLHKPKAKAILSAQTRGRLLIFAVGLNTLDEKELMNLANAPTTMNPGTHLIIEDTLGVLPFWSGQQLFFGPSTGRGVALSEYEFLFNNQICRRAGTDEASINRVIASILEKHQEYALSPGEGLDMITGVSTEKGQQSPSDSLGCISGIVVNDASANGGGTRNTDGPLFLRSFLPSRDERWKSSSSKAIEIPIGINPWSDRTVNLVISQTSAQNAAFIIGKPGTGKSSLLHTIILNASYLYSPDKLQMYLVDMSGVEFQFYATSRLPHARVVAPQAEREFALCVLDEVEAEAARREKMFFENGVKDFSNAMNLPRILVIIDEFQVFFELDDDISSRAKDAIDRIVKKYRKFGINLILATQRLPSSSCLDYSLINNRIAFDCIPDNFTTLFGPSNRQPLLGKGECLYTSKGKLLASMQENEVKSYFADVDRTTDDGVKEVERIVRALDELAPGRTFEPAKVFIKDKEVFFGPDRVSPVAQEDYPEEVNVYLGEPIAVDHDVCVALENSAFDNILILGGHLEVAQGIAINAVLSAADAYLDGSVTCHVISFSKRKTLLYGSAAAFLCGNPFSAESGEVPREEFISFLQEISDEVTRRQKDYSGVYRHVFLLFLDYQNSGIERSVEKTLEFILSNGPQVGIYSVMQAGGVASLKGRTKVDLFNHRVALQMSFEDSREFIGKKWAGSLNDLTKETSPGLQRAYYYNDNNSLYVKFKPYSYRSLILNRE